MSSEEEGPVAWLRKTIEGDLAAAKIISSGGFSPERWDTEPPGQVNPEAIADSEGINAALGLEPEDFPGWSPSWVQLVAYSKLNDEPDEAYCRASDAPFALVDNGRREFDHIIRHDPRNIAARCEAELAILDRCEAMLPPDERDLDEDYHDGRDDWERWRDEAVAELADGILALLADGYKHRAGWAQHWACPACGVAVHKLPLGHSWAIPLTGGPWTCSDLKGGPVSPEEFMRGLPGQSRLDS
jgi:hypothetical protein